MTNLSGDVKWAKIEAPIDEVTEDHILGTVTWASEDELAVLWLNRRQNKTVLVICNADSGNCKKEVIREEPTGWIEVTTPEFQGDEFLDIITTPQGADNGDEWYHVVKYTRNLGSPKAISDGNRTVVTISHWDSQQNKMLECQFYKYIVEFLQINYFTCGFLDIT